MKKLKFGKVKKRVRKQVPWLGHVITDTETALDLNPTENLKATNWRGSRCVPCKGRTMLCGKARCPVVARAYSFQKARHLFDNTDLDGSSPPSTFVGRVGYPYVYAGPMLPPFKGDTEIFDLTEAWWGKGYSEIIDYRHQLVRGMFRVKVTEPEEGGRLLDETREITLSSRPVDAEMILKRIPRQTIQVDSDVQPMGPSGPLKDLSVGNSTAYRPLEKAHYDDDLLATNAVVGLYDNSGVEASRIVRAFQMGMFGEKKKRRLVPTRWSITAVDSILSRHYRDTVWNSPWINEYRVYESNHLLMNNRFVILMMPKAWSYECIEAFYPGSSWNPNGKSIGMCSDWEGLQGRTTYASIGGCYYAVRHMCAEHLANERRQASVLVMREVGPGHIMPVGVWLARECARAAFMRPYKKFETRKEALEYVAGRLTIPMSTWREVSKLLKQRGTQTRIDPWLSLKE